MKTITSIPVITIDGPSGAGKGTLSKAMAKIFQWNILDSGAIYRVLALSALHQKINIYSEKALINLIMHLDINFIYNNGKMEILLKNENVSNKIRTQEVANATFLIAAFPKVRKALLQLQRSFRKYPGLIADGRDMGTVVFKDALVKIFLDASSEARAYRRMLQLQNCGFTVNFEDILFEINNRDFFDKNRNISKLIIAKDALILDSTSLSIAQVIEKALQYACKKLNLLLK